MDFGDAIRALKDGKRVARDGWNGKGFLFLVDVTGLNASIHTDLWGHFPFVKAVCMKTVEDTIVVGWLASQTDMLADDWFEVR